MKTISREGKTVRVSEDTGTNSRGEKTGRTWTFANEREAAKQLGDFGDAIEAQRDELTAPEPVAEPVAEASAPEPVKVSLLRRVLDYFA